MSRKNEKSVENTKYTIERELGIPYNEFDEQQKLIQNHRVIKKKSKDRMVTMVGSGEYTTFVNLNNLSFKSSRKRLDDRLDKIFKESDKQEKREKVKTKILNIFKKNN